MDEVETENNKKAGMSTKQMIDRVTGGPTCPCATCRERYGTKPTEEVTQKVEVIDLNRDTEDDVTKNERPFRS